MSERTSVSELVLRWQEARQHGQARTAAELCADSPDVVDEVRRQLAVLQSIEALDVGEHARVPFFAREFCDGGALDGKLRDGPLPAREAAALIEVLARAMHYAHLRGVVHRDLKPGNILLPADGVPKVTDFGLAKRLDADSDVSRTGEVLGTPAYMAPEQMTGKTAEIGPAGGVSALGA